MLKDITIGQFFPGNSVVHRLDSRVKLVLTTAYVVLLFVARNAAALGIAENYTPRLAMSAWRYLGLGGDVALAGVDTLNIDGPAAAKLEACAVARPDIEHARAGF